MSPRKEIRNFSASQIQAFNDCPRYWLNKWILGERTPDQPNQIRGKEIHALLEEYFKTGILPTDHPYGYHRYVEWLLPILPDPKTERIKPEFKLFLDTPSGKVITGYNDAEGVPLVGIIDALFQRELLTLGDLKTTTDLRNAKTPAELYEDTQLNTYAKWAFEIDESLNTIRAEHWYVLVSSGNDKDGNPKPAVKNPRSNKILQVGIDLTRDSVNRIWDRDCETMERMKVASEVESFEELTPNVNFCDCYNGCDYKEACGISPQQSLFAKLDTPTQLKTKKGKIDMAGFMDKVNKAKAAKGEGPVSTTPKVQEKKDEPEAKSRVAAAMAKAKPAEKKNTPKEESETKAPAKAAPSWKDKLKSKGKASESTKTEKSAEKADSAASEPNPESLTPPDGADRQTSSAEEQGLRDKAAKALEKKQAKKAKDEEKARLKAEGKEPPKTTRKTKSKRGFTLYVGCMPAKGEHKSFELIEDWAAPIIRGLNEMVKEATGHVHYSLTGFNEKDVALGGAIATAIEESGLPDAIVVAGYHPAVDLLIPHATDVVRAIGK